MKTGLALKACMAYQHGEMTAAVLKAWLIQHGAWEAPLNLGLFQQIVLLCGGA